MSNIIPDDIASELSPRLEVCLAWLDKNNELEDKFAAYLRELQRARERSDEAKLLPTIEPPALNKGELYAGIILGKNDERDHHLILLPCDKDDANWGEAKKWAKKAGGELPTRREQALLYANLKEQFEEVWYWSAEQHASLSNYAWFQSFDHGYQDGSHKTNELRARAVRRVPI